MNRSKRLQPVADIAQKKERSAAEQLGKDKSSLSEQQQRLADLQGYRQEYQDRLLSMGQQGISGSVLIGYHQFLGQLDQVIKQQSSVVSQALSTVNSSERYWKKAYTDQSAIRSVINKHIENELATEQKREQKATDELVNNKVAARVVRQQSEASDE